MSYQSEMRAMLYNPIGMYSRELCEIYWAEYAQNNLKIDFENLLYKYA